MKKRLNSNKHPMATQFFFQISSIEESIKNIDPFSRIITTRFSRIHGTKNLIKIKINTQNNKELFVTYYGKHWIQGIKIETSSNKYCQIIFDFFTKKYHNVLSS